MLDRRSVPAIRAVPAFDQVRLQEVVHAIVAEVDVALTGRRSTGDCQVRSRLLAMPCADGEGRLELA